MVHLGGFEIPAYPLGGDRGRSERKDDKPYPKNTCFEAA
jgi:hypothetical protein